MPTQTIELQITGDEAKVLLGGALAMAIHYALDLLTAEREPTNDDYHTLWLYQVIGKKVQKAIGMPDEDMAEILAETYGTPDPRLQVMLIEAQRRCGGRE